MKGTTMGQGRSRVLRPPESKNLNIDFLFLRTTRTYLQCELTFNLDDYGRKESITPQITGGKMRSKERAAFFAVRGLKVYVHLSFRSLLSDNLNPDYSFTCTNLIEIGKIDMPKLAKHHLTIDHGNGLRSSHQDRSQMRVCIE